MLKFLLAALMAVSPVLGQTSPARQEQAEYCSRIAADGHAAAQARQELKMPAQEFQERVMIYIMNLIVAGAPDAFVADVAEALEFGWNTKASPEMAGKVIMDRCMSKWSV